MKKMLFLLVSSSLFCLNPLGAQSSEATKADAGGDEVRIERIYLTGEKCINIFGIALNPLHGERAQRFVEAGRNGDRKRRTEKLPGNKTVKMSGHLAIHDGGDETAGTFETEIILEDSSVKIASVFTAARDLAFEGRWTNARYGISVPIKPALGMTLQGVKTWPRQQSPTAVSMALVENEFNADMWQGMRGHYNSLTIEDASSSIEIKGEDGCWISLDHKGGAQIYFVIYPEFSGKTLQKGEQLKFKFSVTVR